MSITLLPEKPEQHAISVGRTVLDRPIRVRPLGGMPTAPAHPLPLPTPEMHEAPVLPPRLTGLRGFLAGRSFMPFHRFLLAGLLANTVVALLFVLGSPTWSSALTTTITAASVNMGLAVLVRQQNVVNLMFSAATSAPLSWPLRVRTALAKVYQVGGGIHVGCAIAATAWFAAFTAVTLTAPAAPGDPLHALLAGIAVAIAVDLTMIAVLARPSMRERHHNVFEAAHRYGGWLAITLFGCLTVVVAASSGRNVVDTVVDSPNSWILAMILVCALIPWLQMRRVPVEISTPSDHVALVHFADHRRPRVGSATKVARRPFGEYHAFANMTEPDSDGFRIAVSRAGDWTSDLIADTPDHLWVRGVPTTGVGTVGRLFTRVVWITTGSGIAPCLPHLLCDPTPAHLVWVTRNPQKTYGTELTDKIFAAQPDAVLWNTDRDGKPDLVELAHRAYRDTGAEAVICISNKATTMRVVTELQQRGIPAFGPIWDS